MIGQKVGPYEILEEVGRGGMATVYRAYQTNVDRFVALKIIQKGISLDPVAMDRFGREARLVARLEHPHILPVYDFNGTNDPPFIVMRFMPTGTLKDIMQKTRIPLGEVVHLFRQICSAMDYAHRSGVVHRDIKPSNIMIDGDGNAFITDFGIARMVESDANLTASGIAIGTPGYMAPEQGMGSSIDGRADIYAMGVMLYEMLSGKPPYTAETPMGVILKHINEPVPSILEANPDLPPVLDTVIRKALAKTAVERYQTAGEFGADLAAAIGAVPTRPIHLKDYAAKTIEELEKAREEIAKTRAERVSAAMTLQEGLKDEKTFITDTKGRTSATLLEPMPTHGSSRMPLIIGMVVLLLLASGAVFFFLSNQEEENQADQATQAFIAQQTSTREAQLASIAISEQTQLSFRTTQLFVAQQTALQDTQVYIAQAGTIVQNTQEKSGLETDSAVTSTAYRQETETATASLTPPTVTDTPTFTYTPSATLSYTPTVAPSDTVAPTDTPVPTDTPLPVTSTDTQTPTSTNTETPSPTPTASDTPTLIPTPTPLPAGQMPFLADMEEGNSLVGWQYDAEQWRLSTEGGNTALVGTSGFSGSPLVILGQEVPEWNEADSTDLVYRYKIKLAQQGSGGRFVFRFSDAGYYVLEMSPGVFNLKRGLAGGINRSQERPVTGGTYSQVGFGQWYDVVAWVEGGRIFVYLDNLLIMKVNDTTSPLPAGGIVLQTLSANINPVAWDDIIVQRAELSTDHFDNVSSFPDSWAREPVAGVTIENTNGNQAIQMKGAAKVVPLTSQLGDFIFSCNMRSAEGNYQFTLRDSSNGKLVFKGEAGNLRVVQQDASGAEVASELISQFYSRDFSIIIVELVGNRVRVYDRSGRLKVDKIFDGLPSAGTVSFETSQSNDILLIDDCLFAATASSRTSEADFAFEILALLSDAARRPYREALDDFSDDFSDRLQKDEWWESAPGEYINDNSADEHAKYYQIDNLTGTQQLYRRIRAEIDSSRNVFNDGLDRTTFRDSSDIYVKVDVRFPAEAPVGSVAWVGVRSGLNITRTALDQYQIELVKEADGKVRVRIRPFLQADKTYIYEELLPDVVAGDWVELIVVTEDDRIAFFANGRYLTAIRPVSVLGGTMALGVEASSIADFDDVVIRDTTVNE